MPIQNYGVLKGKATDRILATARNEHFQILINRGDDPHRIAINTKSSEAPSQVLFYADDNFHHNITDEIEQANLPDGFTPLKSKPDGLALDFIRSNLFDVKKMKPLASNIPGADNDLNERVDFFVQKAIKDETAIVYAFGQHWQDKKGADQYFKEINPSTGIHDIHMNQGNRSGKYKKDNGIYQDGGLIFHYASRNQWAAVFTAFQSQSFHTNDHTGDPVNDVPGGGDDHPESTSMVRIIGAMVNPIGGDKGKEFVLLLNKSGKDINLSGWKIADKEKKTQSLGNATIEAGETLKVRLNGSGAQLSNEGGTITLLNKKGQKVDGVSYTKKDAAREGEVIEL